MPIVFTAASRYAISLDWIIEIGTASKWTAYLVTIYVVVTAWYAAKITKVDNKADISQRELRQSRCAALDEYELNYDSSTN